MWDWEYGLCVKTLLVHSYSVWGLGLTHKPDPKDKDKLVPLLGTGSWDRSVKCLHLKKFSWLVNVLKRIDKLNNKNILKLKFSLITNVFAMLRTSFKRI